MNSNWRVYGKRADFKGIADKYGIDQVLARIIRNRDISGDDELDMYLNGDIKDMHNPVSMKDAVRSVDIIIQKIKDNCKIRIIGDYDIDGICSIYILYRGLTAAGANVDYIVPHRINDGYGINERFIDDAIADGVDTIITCDNGISAYNQIKYAKDNGLTVIVTDHHDVPFDEVDGSKEYHIPPADAVVNPKQQDCQYPFKLLCGAGVAYKIISLIYDRLNLDKKELEEYLEFMAIATVGDIVDLIDENRVVVKYGLTHIAKTVNVGLRALVEESGVDINNLTSYHIGFVIGPCLNASGRIDTAKKAIELMLCKDYDTAHNMARELINLNNERKQMTEKETDKAIELVESTGMTKDKVLVVYLPDCHESIAGIIAGRIKEKYYRPTFVITNSADGAKGSGRSIESYNMAEELNKCKNILTKFGGHPMAAGLSLKIADIDTFRNMLNANTTLTENDLIPKTWIDVPMPVSYISMGLVGQLKKLEPFGKGNEKPVFADKDLYVKESRIVGGNKDTLKMKFETADGCLMDAVMFHVSDKDSRPMVGNRISAVYYPDINVYKGRSSLQLVIKEWKE